MTQNQKFDGRAELLILLHYVKSQFFFRNRSLLKSIEKIPIAVIVTCPNKTLSEKMEFPGKDQSF